MREVECQVDLVGHTSKYGAGSGTKLLESSWTLSFSGVAQRERQCEDTHKPPAVLEFCVVNKRVTSVPVTGVLLRAPCLLRVSGQYPGKGSAWGVCTCISVSDIHLISIVVNITKM